MDIMNLIILILVPSFVIGSVVISLGVGIGFLLSVLLSGVELGIGVVRRSARPTSGRIAVGTVNWNGTFEAVAFPSNRKYVLCPSPTSFS